MEEKKDGEPSTMQAMSSSAMDRTVLQMALASRDFFDDGASSLLPNSFVPRHRTKPSRAMEDALEFRRQQKKEREESLSSSRRRTRNIELDNSPERIAHRVQHANDEQDELNMVSKFMRGGHWIVNGADVERKQLDREERLHAQSAQVIVDSSVMQQDYLEKRIGKVVLPDETPEEEAEHERQSDYIYKINSRIGLFDTYKSYLVEVMRLQDCCNSQEEEALFLIEEVEKGRKSNDFHWQLERNNRIKELRAKTAVDTEDLDHARMRMRSIRKEINFKFPEMSTALLFEEEKDVDLDVTADVNPDDQEAEAEVFRDAGMSVYGWIIGRLTHDGKICCILFGQFSRDVQPPSDGWVFVGKNVDRNLITTATMSDASISASQSALSEGGGVTNTADSDHVMTEIEMLSAKGDNMTVTPVTLTDDSYKAATNQKPSETLSYYVSGSSIFSVNGRYMEYGVACNVSKYRNLRGWSVYRVALMEIPDLGIMAENCYGALKGPPISVMLDRKSDRAFAELVDRTRDIKDGSVQFKRRFAEMSRSGQRIINSDQTSQLYRNQELRAEARSESDRMMMMILQAVSSAKSGEDHVIVETPKRAGVMEAIHEPDDAEDAEGATHASESIQSVHTFKSRSSVRSSRSKLSRTKRGTKNTGAASVATSGTAATDAETAMKGVLTGVDLDIKVTLSKGIHYQTGSQGFPLARRKGFLEEEAELSGIVTKCIEAREEEIFALRIESEKVSKTYLESEGLLRDLDTDAIMSDLFRQMRKVREATILTAEALGAWARLCYKEKNKSQKVTLYNADSVPDPKSLRTYCVIIAFKGPQIYPQSQEMKSQTGRWSRGLEKAKVATNFRYIGEYKTMEEALESFSGSISKLLPEQLLAEDAQGARAVVGLRSCGKHFLVRSNAVPNNTPCECCRAKLLATPDLVAPSALQDDTENLQQFIWHGIDYLEKLWTDVDFLDENILLKRAFPQMDVKYNPLLLLSEDFSSVLGQVTVEDGPVLHYLKGRQEQVRDAAKSGTIISKKFTDRELMGLPYRTQSNLVVDLDKEAATIEADKAHQDAFKNSIKSSWGKDSSVNVLRPPLPTSPLNGTGVATSTLPLARSINGDESLPFTPWSSLSPRAALESADVLGRLMPGTDYLTQVDFTKRAVGWLEEDHLDFVGKNRLVRSFHILAQSTTLTKHKLPQTVMPIKLKESVLKRNNILRSTSMPGLLGIATERSLDRDGVLHNDDKIKTIETEVGYFYRGAFFAVPQMRAPPAHRIDDVWCRSDVGEWHGLSKGRAMRSYEFQENIKLQGRLKNEERKRLQMMIKRHIENDIVYTDVAALKSLIVQSKEIRGSVLALDVIQAEQFLKYRVHLIITIRKMQAMARGTFSRRRVRKMKAALKSAALRLKQVEIESISLSRKIVPRMILDGISSALAKLTATRFRITMNFSGMVTVLTIRKAVRSEKRGFYLCPACTRQDIVKVLDRANKCFRSETAACTCRWWQGEERWTVQIFDPLSHKEELITLTMSQVREHIEFITAAEPLMNQEYRQRALIGKSFDRLQALFDASFVTFDGQLEHSNSLARRRAAEESCILPLVPRVVAEDVLEATRRRQNFNLAIDRILPFGFQYTDGPLTVTAIDHIEDSVALKQWEPIADLEFACRHVAAVKHHIIILETRVQNTRQIMIQADSSLFKHVTRNTELDTMRYEDSRTAFLRLDEDIKIARDRIQRAMKYQKEGITSFQLEEINSKLDWKQSYDEKEDGNAWEGLNNCRKLEKKWSGTLQHYHSCSAKIPLLVIEKTRLLKDAEKARENYDFAVSEAVRYAPTLGQADDVLLDVKQISRAAIKNAVAVLCMPRKRRWPNQRRVQRVPYRNVFIRDPFVRAQKENIGLWNLLERRVMALRPILKSFTGKAVLRCIVEIYQDPLTNFVMVRINQDENPVEESTQHIDMHVSKTELSDMTNSALDTDILLRPGDVQVVLSKAPNWPAVHIQKEVHFFKTIDCFVRNELTAAAEIAVIEPEVQQVEEVQQVALEFATALPEVRKVKEWIPPSKRPRSLDGVKVHPTKAHAIDTLVSYATSRTRKELSQVETARALMTYLRLHPYTGRPCLGLVHFVRRQIYCVKSLTRCRWFFDLAKGMPSTWTNELVDELRHVGGRLWKVTTRGCLDSLEVRLYAHTKKLGLTIVIPFRDIVENLARNQPILLASLLCETITNRYSAELHNNLLDYVDMQLPGEEPRRFWRQSLFGEMPRLEFQQSKSSKYRGPIYKTHRFFSGRYLEAVFSISANLDLRIQLGRPTDGNFWGHVYTGDTIVVDISRDELRAYIAKASTYESLVPSLYLGSLRLLHPNHWLELFPLLLDVVILPPSAVSGSAPVSSRPLDALLDGEDDEMVQISEEGQITERLCRKVQYVMDKFNAWATRTKGQCDPLRPELMQSVLSNIEALNNRMPWTLELKKDDASRKLVEVRSEVWKSRDLRRFKGKYDFSFQESRESLLSHTGTNSSRHFKPNDSISVGTSGVGANSFWSVRILTNEFKFNYFVDVLPTKDTDAGVETLLAEEESTLMAIEESISRGARLLEKQTIRRFEIAEEIARVQRKIKMELMPAVLAVDKLVADTKRRLKEIGRLYRDSLDAWFSSRAGLVYNNATMSLGIKGGGKKAGKAKAKRLLFMPGSFSPEAKAVVEVTTVAESVAVAAPKLRKQPLLETGKETFVPAAAKQPTLPKNIQISLKKFDKVIGAFQVDMSTRSDVDVRLLSSNRHKGYTGKRFVHGQTTFLDNVDYSSAWYPRYDAAAVQSETSSNFRDTDQWCHYAFASKPSRTETRVLNVKGTLLLISDPIVGPFDIVAFNLYDATNSQSWSVIFAGGGDLPRFGHAPKPQKSSAGREEGAVVIVGDKLDLVPLYRLCAERLVWNAVTKATVNAVIAANMDELDQGQGLIEEEIAENLDYLESLKEQLTGVLSETAAEVPDHHFVQAPAAALSVSNALVESAVDSVDALSVQLVERQINAGGAIPEIVHHSVHYFRDSGFGIRVFGMMVPADEALGGIPLVVFSQDWLRLCRHYLGDQVLNRRFTTSAFIWSRESDLGLATLNPRANRWIEDYEKNYGWRNGKEVVRRMKKQMRLEAKLHGGNHPPYTSDVIILLRYGERELPLLTAWLKDRYDEYAPMRELRRQKEGREREFRISNHKIFCTYVYGMAASFLDGIEAMYKAHGSINTEQVDRYSHEKAAISYYCRVLLSRFLSLRTDADKKFAGFSLEEKTEAGGILDEAFLIDTDVVHPSEETLLRFDALPAESCLTDRDGILQWDPTAFVLDPLDSPMLQRVDLQPRVGQVVYAIYKLHCFACKRSANTCKFPGCRCIRLESAAIMQSPQSVHDLSEIGQLLPEMKGTGSHPIERSIRRYLLQGRDLYNHLLPVTLERPLGVSPAEEIQLEEFTDQTEAKRLAMIEYLRITWQALQIEGHEFRYVSRRVLRPELSSVLCAQDVLEAKGGIKTAQDEEPIADKKDDLEAFIPRPIQAVGSAAASDSGGESSKSIRATTSSATLTTIVEEPTEGVSVTGGLIQVPNSLMLALLGGCGVDGHGRAVPLWAIDPYPAENSENSPKNKVAACAAAGRKEIQRPMAKPMYDWLVDHLCLSRPSLLPCPASGDRGQLLPTAASLKLDRQHCEGTCFLVDGSLVLVQLLYGVLVSATLCSDDLSGAPSGAIRYCPSSLFADLHRGLTVVAYDVRAGVTRATALEGRALSRVAEAFEVADDNIPLIACKILEYASKVIRLSRVGEVCTAVAVDVNGISRQSDFTLKDNGAINARVKPLGRRESVFDARKERLLAAKQIAQKRSHVIMF